MIDDQAVDASPPTVHELVMAVPLYRGRANPEKITSFEQYKRSIQGIEVIMFGEFYERACFIVEDR